MDFHYMVDVCSRRVVGAAQTLHALGSRARLNQNPVPGLFPNGTCNAPPTKPNFQIDRIVALVSLKYDWLKAYFETAESHKQDGAPREEMRLK